MINLKKLNSKQKKAIMESMIYLILDPLNYIGKGFIDDSDIDLLFNALRKIK